MKAGIAARRALRQSAGMSKRELIAKHRDAILALAAKHGATDVRIFGSVARGDDDETSDVDFLVTFPDEGTLGRLCGLADDLETLLGCKVDLLTDHRWIRPTLRKNLEEDAVPV